MFSPCVMFSFRLPYMYLLPRVLTENNDIDKYAAERDFIKADDVNKHTLVVIQSTSESSE